MIIPSAEAVFLMPSTAKIPDDDGGDDPGGDATDGDHQDHCRIDNQFIGDRIEKLSHGGYDPVSSGNVSVEQIG